MLYQEFDIPKYDWKVFAFYDTTFEDADVVMDCLYEMGCSGEIANRAFSNLNSGILNTGLTFSKKHKTCIVLGRTTDKENFAHTYAHEIAHCAIHLADEYGIDLQSETLAYIIGDLAAVMLPYASKFLCDHCRTKKLNDYEE